MKYWQKICFVLGVFLFFLGIYLFVKPILCIPKEEGVDKQSIYCLINKSRFKKLLSPLSTNKKLEKAAELRVFDITVHNQFSHQSISGQSFGETIKSVGYEYQLIGENLARGFSSNQEIINSWLKSASHSANILSDRYEDMGIAIKETDRLPQNEKIIVILFGK